LEIPRFILERRLNRQLRRLSTDFLEPQPKRQRAADRAFERVIAPPALHVFNRAVPLILGNVADRDWTTADVTRGEARHQMPQLANIPGILPAEQIITHGRIQFKGGSGRLHLSQEVGYERQDVLAAFLQRRQLARPLRDAKIEKGLKAAAGSALAMRRPDLKNALSSGKTGQVKTCLVDALTAA
jgi:hypothetical protein